MALFQPNLPSILGSLTRLLRSKVFLVPACVMACVMCAWKLLHRMNSHLSMRSLNNFESDKSWDWTKEIILVTGGSNGIGANMVRRFSKLGIQVVIWDMVAPSPDLLGKHGDGFETC